MELTKKAVYLGNVNIIIVITSLVIRGKRDALIDIRTFWENVAIAPLFVVNIKLLIVL